MTGLQARGLSYSFGKRPILIDVEINVGPGEVVGLLGPNGAGKTTLFRLLSGELSCAGCDISIDGETVSRLPLLETNSIGSWLHSAIAFCPAGLHGSGEFNVWFARRIQGRKGSALSASD